MLVAPKMSVHRGKSIGVPKEGMKYGSPARQWSNVLLKEVRSILLEGCGDAVGHY